MLSVQYNQIVQIIHIKLKLWQVKLIIRQASKLLLHFKIKIIKLIPLIMRYNNSIKLRFTLFIRMLGNRLQFHLLITAKTEF